MNFITLFIVIICVQIGFVVYLLCEILKELRMIRKHVRGEKIEEE
jgi:hypothetical protein